MDDATESAKAIERWLAVLDSGGKSRLTIAAYRRALAHFVRWSENSYGQSFELCRVITRDVRDWKSLQLTVEKAAPATINQRLSAQLEVFCISPRKCAQDNRASSSEWSMLKR